MNKILDYVIIKLVKRSKFYQHTEKRYKFLVDFTENTNIDYDSKIHNMLPPRGH